MRNKDIITGVIKSAYGVFTEDDFYGPGNNKVKISRQIEKNNDSCFAQVTLRNISNKSIRINSAAVIDVFLAHVDDDTQVLEHGWLQSSPSSYKSLNKATKLNWFFYKSDHNPYSFNKAYGYLEGSIVSEWLSVVRGISDVNLLVGAITTSNQFSQIFIRKENEALRLRVTCQFDGLELKPGKQLMSEKIVFLVGEEELILKKFAGLLADKMNIIDVKEPIKAMCCSYYWNGNYVDEKMINCELDAIERLPTKLRLDYVQIDAGYCKYWGDWLETTGRFPNGFKDIVTRINSIGYKAGIWIAPFIADPRSKLFRLQKDWCMKDHKGKFLEGRLATPIDKFVKSSSFRVFDPTNKNYQHYLVDIVRNFKNCGFEFLKLDFMYPIGFSPNFSAPMTRVQALRKGLELIRDVVGKKIYILATTSPLSPLVGLVDFARTGTDTLIPHVRHIPVLRSIVNNRMLSANFKNSQMRGFLNGKVWVNDPDVLLFRGRTGIKHSLSRKHRSLAKKSNTSLWLGDSLVSMTYKDKKQVIRYFNN